jgi:putative inorganic carbon (HCO3(-)) transporter
MDFFLFLLLNGVLFLRPQDLWPSLAGIPLYNLVIVANLVVSGPAVVKQIRTGWRRMPAMVCVVGILVAIVLSLVARSDLSGAWYWGLEFAKVAVYFLLLTAVLKSPSRFGWFLAAIVALTVTVAGLAVLHFHGQLELPAIEHAREVTYDTASGARIDTIRLAAYGIFADPNDLSMIVVLGMLICLGALAHRGLGAQRFALLLPLGFLAYSLMLTQSRGGLLALVAGLGALLVNRLGVARACLALVAVVPLVLAVFAGRQTSIADSIASGTGEQRTDLWYAGLQMLKWSPLVGMGHGQFVQEEGLVAHSSYIQALAEWGLFGGAMFIGLFYLVLKSVWRLKPVRRRIASPALRHFQPYMFGALAAYCVSMLTLTRCDVVPTYLVAGLGVSYEQLARRGTSLRPLEVNSRLALQVLLVTIAFTAAVYVYIRFIYRLF